MAAKKKSAPPPPPPPAAARPTSSSDEEDSSSDEDNQFIAKPNPTNAQTPNTDDGNTESGSGSESDSESEPEKVPPTKPIAVVRKPPESESESEDSSEEEDERGAKEEKKPKSAAPPKPSDEADQPPASGKSPVVQRIWSLEDQVTLLKALSDYKTKNGKLPPKQQYAAFLSTFSESIGFPVTEKQLFNKIRMLRFNYSQKKKKGDALTFHQPHDVIVFRMCKDLFGEVGESSKGAAQEAGADVGKKERKKGKEVVGSGLEEANGEGASVGADWGKKNKKRKKVEVSGLGLEEPNGSTATVSADVGKKSNKKRKVEVNGLGFEEANGGTVGVGTGVANDGVDNNGDGGRCYVYLVGLIQNMWTQEIFECLSADDMMARIEKTKLQDLEAKAKKLKIEELELHARRAQISAEMLDLLADAVEND